MSGSSVKDSGARGPRRMVRLVGDHRRSTVTHKVLLLLWFILQLNRAELSVPEKQPPSNGFLEHDSAPTVPSAPLITSNKTPLGWAGTGDWRRAATA